MEKRTITISRAATTLFIFAFLVIGFALGTRSADILGFFQVSNGINNDISAKLDTSSLQNTYALLRAKYDGKIDPQTLLDGANAGMVASLDDPFTEYMTKAQADEFNKMLTGDVGAGIGAVVSARTDGPTIVRTLPDNPAERAGLKSGDIIVLIDEKPTAKTEDITKDLDDTVSRLRGAEGTKVKVTVKRGNQMVTVEVARQKINNLSVYSEVQGDVGILTITRFDEQTGMLARSEAQSLLGKGIKKIILDMRDNGGGYLSSAEQVASLWLDDKAVLYTDRVGEKITGTHYASGVPILKGLPTIVLINGNTASASEVVTAALQDNKAASTVGEKTFGKGVAQIVFPGNNQAQVKITVEHWFTPGGKNIHKQGIAPNKGVAMTIEDLRAGNDPQLKSALDSLK